MPLQEIIHNSWHTHMAKKWCNTAICSSVIYCVYAKNTNRQHSSIQSWRSYNTNLQLISHRITDNVNSSKKQSIESICAHEALSECLWTVLLSLMLFMTDFIVLFSTYAQQTIMQHNCGRDTITLWTKTLKIFSVHFYSHITKQRQWRSLLICTWCCTNQQISDYTDHMHVK